MIFVVVGLDLNHDSGDGGRATRSGFTVQSKQDWGLEKIDLSTSSTC
jgi:hypothetical protein